MKYLFILLTLFVVGCDSNTKSVEYYLSDKAETKKRVSECKNDPHYESNPDCRNAIKAYKKIRTKEKWAVKKKD